MYNIEIAHDNDLILKKFLILKGQKAAISYLNREIERLIAIAKKGDEDDAA